MVHCHGPRRVQMREKEWGTRKQIETRTLRKEERWKPLTTHEYNYKILTAEVWESQTDFKGT